MANKKKTDQENYSSSTSYGSSNKGLKIALIGTSLAAVAGIVIAIIFMLRKPASPEPTTSEVVLTFDAGEGSWNSQHAKTLMVNKGETWKNIQSKKPSDPESSISNFDYWTIQNNIIKDDYVFNTNTNIVAKYSAHDKSISFDPKGGTWVEGGGTGPIKVEIPYSKMPDPGDTLEREGYVFTGWHPALTPVTKDSPSNYEAQWEITKVTVSFDSDGGSQVAPITVNYGGDVTLPEEPTKTGYEFGGWYTAKGDQGTLFSFEDIKKSDTAYAHWNAHTRNAKFIANGGHWSGGTKEDIDVPTSFGVLPKAPAVSYDDGHIFNGWERASDKGIGLLPMDDDGETYTAQWKITQVTVSFDTDGGDAVIPPMSVDYGGTIENPPEGAGTKTGYEFGGWYTAKGGQGSIFTFTNLTKSGVAYAKWNPKKFTIYFDCTDRGEWRNPGEAETRSIPDVTYGTTYNQLLEQHSSDLAVDPVDPDHEHFVCFTDSNGKQVLGDYQFTATATYTASFASHALVSIDPGLGYFDSGEDIHDTRIIYVDTTKTPPTTWGDILKDNPVKSPVGYEDPYWECHSDSTDEWTKITDTSTQIKQSMYFRAVCKEKTDLTLTISPGEGTWVNAEEGDESAPKTFSNITYGLTFGEFATTHAEDLGLVPPEGKAFAYFAFDGTDEEVVGSSYVIDGTEDIHAYYVDSALTKEITLNAGSEGKIAGLTSVTIYAPYGKQWSDIKDSYTPIMNEDKKYDREFKYFTTDGTAQFADDSVIGESTPNTLIAAYGDIAADDFQTDSWAVIAREANKGVSAFKETYGFDDETNKLIGATRTVDVFGKTYHVQVIGADQDVLDDNKKATLTFQFQEVVTDGVSYISYGDENNEYETSNVRSYLNDTLYNFLPTDLHEAISKDKVSKKTYKYTGTSVSLTNDYLFPLSLKEMNFSTDAEGTPVEDEGIIYTAYYDGLVTLRKNKLTDSDPTPTAYWTRSPSATHEGAAWAIDIDGELGFSRGFDLREPPLMNESFGVAPAFCIGSHI